MEAVMLRVLTQGGANAYDLLWEEMQASARRIAGSQADEFCRLPAPKSTAEALEREAALSSLRRRMILGPTVSASG